LIDNNFVYYYYNKNIRCSYIILTVKNEKKKKKKAKQDIVSAMGPDLFPKLTILRRLFFWPSVSLKEKVKMP